jgi:hypothetical protein
VKVDIKQIATQIFPVFSAIASGQGFYMRDSDGASRSSGLYIKLGMKYKTEHGAPATAFHPESNRVYNVGDTQLCEPVDVKIVRA